MSYGISLLDKAKTRASTDAAVARELGITRQSIDVMRRTRRVSPEMAALLAAYLNEDATYAVKMVLTENAPPGLAERLNQVFRRAAGVAGVAVLAAMTSHQSPANAGMTRAGEGGFVNIARQAVLDTLYIVRMILGRLKQCAERGRLRRAVSLC